jgi:hypothetical protein
MSVNIENRLRAAVSVAEMARMVGLSRARFYQLIGRTFPHPVYHLFTRRPLYTEEQQAVCLEVRRRNCGIDGRPVLFYTARVATAPASRPRPQRERRATVAAVEIHEGLIAALRGLGMASVTGAQVAAALRDLYPRGTAGIAEAEQIRATFLHLRRQNSADNLRG